MQDTFPTCEELIERIRKTFAEAYWQKAGVLEKTVMNANRETETQAVTIEISVKAYLLLTQLVQDGLHGRNESEAAQRIVERELEWMLSEKEKRNAS